MIKLIIRRFFSLCKRVRVICRSSLARLVAIYGNDNVSIGKNFSSLGESMISCTDAGHLSVGNDCMLSAGCQLICRGGSLTIGNNVFIGKGVVVVCSDKIEIGNDALIAEYTVIRDQDHCVEERPIRSSGFISTPIYIGDDVWIGAKSTILRGSLIGSGSVIGAHSLVRSQVPAFCLAAGCPAKILKTLNH